MTGVSPLAGNPLRAILEVSQALVSSNVYEQALGAVVAKIGESMDVWSCDLQSCLPEVDCCVYDAYWSVEGATDEDRAYMGTVTRIADRPDIRAILESDDLVEQHVDDPKLSEHDREHLRKWGYRSTLDMPLRIGDRVVGILGLQEKRFVRRFVPAERDQFMRLCELAAIGVHNAGVLRRDHERGRHLASLAEVSHALATVQDSPGVFGVIAPAAAAAFGAPRVVVYDYDSDADTMTPRAIHQDEYDADYDTVGVAESPDELLGDRELLTRSEPFLEQASDPDIAEVVRESYRLWGETTCLTIPLLLHGEPLGMLMVIWTGQERLVTPDESALAKGIGEQAAVALGNARLRAAGRTSHPGGDAE